MSWRKEDFVEGGIKGVTEFIGILDEVEEEVPGKFDKLQDIYHFSDVEITASEEEVTLENNELTAYTTHSRRKNSTSGKLADIWIDFCEAHNLDAPPDSLYGVRARYQRQTFDFGPDMNPGSGFAPIDIIDEKPKKAVPDRAARPSQRASKPKDDEPPALDKELVELARDTAGEDGATRDLLRRDLTKKSSQRTKVVAAGGIDNLLAQMVEQGYLFEEDGVYTAADSPI